MNADEQKTLQQRLAVEFAPLDGVSGLAVDDAGIRVYVSDHTLAFRRRLERLLAHEAPGMPVDFIATAEFRKHLAG